MMLTALLCLLFFAGHLLLKTHGQSLAFLALGAGYQTLSFLIPAPDGTAISFDTFLLVSLSSVAGYVAWRMSRRFLVAEGRFARHRLGLFAGVAFNLAIALLLLWQTGTLTFD